MVFSFYHQKNTGFKFPLNQSNDIKILVKAWWNHIDHPEWFARNISLSKGPPWKFDDQRGNPNSFCVNLQGLLRNMFPNFGSCTLNLR